jgi:hypothetical protein
VVNPIIKILRGCWCNLWYFYIMVYGIGLPHWSNFSKIENPAFLTFETTNQWIGLVGKIYRKAAWSSWENRWFPVEFPLFPGGLSLCRVYVFEPFNYGGTQFWWPHTHRKTRTKSCIDILYVWINTSQWFLQP